VKIKEWLEKNYMTQSDLANECGVTIALVSRIVNGYEPSVRTKRKLLKVLPKTVLENHFKK